MKVLEKMISKNYLRSELTRVHIKDGYIYATDSHHLVKIKTSIYPNLEINLKEGEYISLDSKSLKMMNKSRYFISKDEIKLVNKKKDEIILRPPTDIANGIIIEINKLIEKLLNDVEIKDGWNINGAYFNPQFLTNISEVTMRLENTNVPRININTTTKGVGVITLKNIPVEDFVAICMSLTRE